MTSAVLLVGAVVGPLEQVRIGEATSLDKHVAFGIVFAAPLIGVLLATALRRARVVTVPLVAGALACLTALGLHYSHQFMTSWIPDSPLLSPLRSAVAAQPGEPILGEEPSPERWALRSQTTPTQWDDTFVFSYRGLHGLAAYQSAIGDRYFGVIYLIKERYAGFPHDSPTPTGADLYPELRSGATPYHLARTVTMVDARGVTVGKWYLFVPTGHSSTAAAASG
jgi:hypothetical protein